MKTFHFCEIFLFAYSIIIAVTIFVLCIPCPPSLLSFPFVPFSPIPPLSIPPSHLLPSPPPAPFPSPGAGRSASRGLHDCVLLCSTARNVGQTWQGGCCAMTTTHCTTLYSIHACCASLCSTPSLCNHVHLCLVCIVNHLCGPPTISNVNCCLLHNSSVCVYLCAPSVQLMKVC